MAYLGGVVDVVLPEGDAAAADPPEGLPQGLLDALDPRQRALHGQLVAGVQGAPAHRSTAGGGTLVWVGRTGGDSNGHKMQSQALFNICINSKF